MSRQEKVSNLMPLNRRFSISKLIGLLASYATLITTVALIYEFIVKPFYAVEFIWSLTIVAGFTLLLILIQFCLYVHSDLHDKLSEAVQVAEELGEEMKTMRQKIT